VKHVRSSLLAAASIISIPAYAQVSVPLPGSAANPPSATEPAWDWQFIISNYEVAQEYGYRARVIYRERCSREEVLEEYKNWRATLTR